MPGEKPFEEVRKEVEKDLRDLRAKQRAKSELRKIRYAVEDKKAEPYLDGLKKGETGFFERGRLSGKAPASGVVGELAFGLSEKEKISREREGGGRRQLSCGSKRKERLSFRNSRMCANRWRAHSCGSKGLRSRNEKRRFGFRELKDKKRDLSAIAEELKVKALKPEAFKRTNVPPALGSSPGGLEHRIHPCQGRVRDGPNPETA